VEGHFTGQRHLGENLDQHLVAGKGKLKEKQENIYFSVNFVSCRFEAALIDS
jgi:hypothetical protein